MYFKHKKPKTQNIEERNLCAAKGKLQPFLTIEKTIASRTLMDVCLTTGEKISLKSTPSFWLNPLETNLALYLIPSFSERPGFLLNIHLQPTTCLPLGSSASFQVWFLYRDSISSFIANNQFSASGWLIASCCGDFAFEVSESSSSCGASSSLLWWFRLVFCL